MAVIAAVMLFLAGVGVCCGVALIASVLVMCLPRAQTKTENPKNGIRKTSIAEGRRHRLKYLLKKLQANAFRCACAMATLGCGGLSLLVLLAFIATLRDPDEFTNVPFLAYFLMLDFLGGSTWLFARLWRSSATAANTLDYVPPVREQIAVLPADEVLLRGSDEPSATPEELLRAAHGGTVEAGEDLLLPSLVDADQRLPSGSSSTEPGAVQDIPK